MGQALYRKYRSKKLSEIVGQDHITQTLASAIKQGRISHAYLLTGPRGVGKTSIARILAHEINDLPYDDEAAHLDIIEIDAASNRRIDEIRDLRDKVYVAPTSSKYKVYIIDEVHMLTREAFNALLKTLEEPPEHAVFILATTDAHKVPETIVSRTQRFSFKPVPTSQVAAHLATIAKAEGIKVTPEALNLLAEHGEGSFRDSISLLDQACNTADTVDEAVIERLLGVPSAKAIDNLLEALGTASSAELMSSIQQLYDQGYQPAAIAKSLAQRVRHQLLTGGNALDETVTYDLLRGLLDVPTAIQADRLLEIVLLQHRSGPTQPLPQTVKVAASPVKTETVEQIAPPISEPENNTIKPIAKSEKKSASSTLDDAAWPQILQALKQRHNTLYSVVRMAVPSFEIDDDTVTVRLAFTFAFHQKRISDQSNRQMLSDIIYELTGQRVAIDCVTDSSVEAPKPKIIAAPTPDPVDVTAISNIFGGGELLES